MNWNILPGLTFCISICILCFNSIFFKDWQLWTAWLRSNTQNSILFARLMKNHTPLFPREIVFHAVIFLTEEVTHVRDHSLWAYDQECSLCLPSVRIQHRHRMQCVIKHTQCRASEHTQLTFQPVTCLSWRSDQMVKSNTHLVQFVAVCFSHFTTLCISTDTHNCVHSGLAIHSSGTPA